MDQLQTEKWITTDEAAKYEQITPQMVREKARSGKYSEIKEVSSRGGRSGVSILIRPESLSPEAYIRYYAANNQPAQVENIGPEWERATQSQRERAVFVHKRLNAWREYRENHDGNKTEIDDKFITAWEAVYPEDKISQATLYRDLQKYEKGGLGALLPQHGIHRRGLELIDPEAKSTFVSMYLDMAKPSISHCIELVQTINFIKKKDWTLPTSKRTFERIVEALDAEVVTLGREGKTAFNNKHGIYISRNYDNLEVMQLWQSDHQQQDFFVRGPHGEIARPWQTVWMDARSRTVLGWHCSMGGDTDTIMAAFCNASFTNGNLIPEHIHIDNGRDYSGKRLTGGDHKFRKIDEAKVTAMIDHLKIVTHFCIPENPQAKHIERVFRTLREYFDKYQESYTGNRPCNRPETAEEARKAGLVMSWEQYLKTSADAWLYYNNRPHSGKGMDGKSPLQVFNEGMSSIKARRVDPDALRFMTWRTSDTRQVRRGGLIQVDNRVFSSLTLMDHQGEEVYIRYNPFYNKVWVFSMDDVQICNDAELVEGAEWFNNDDIQAGMKQKNGQVKRAKQKLQAIRDAADPVAQNKKALFSLQTQMAEQRAADVPKAKPTVIEPVRTTFDQIAKELAAAEEDRQQVQWQNLQATLGGTRRMAVGAENYQNRNDIDRRIDESFKLLGLALQKMNKK